MLDAVLMFDVCASSQASKSTSEEVTESLRVAELTEQKIDIAREGCVT